MRALESHRWWDEFANITSYCTNQPTQNYFPIRSNRKVGQRNTIIQNSRGPKSKTWVTGGPLSLILSHIGEWETVPNASIGAMTPGVIRGFGWDPESTKNRCWIHSAARE